jgi:prepilin-type N-terminal cleavage/methylation domain-containing protein
MTLASNKKYKAFSFIEISIALLIIGVLMSITIQIKDFIHSAKIERARSLTQNSPILSIPDLAHWYEPVLQDSFETAIDVSGNIIEDGTQIKIWFDKNNSRLHPAHAIQNNSSYQPQYFNKVFDNTIPALRFFGTNDYMQSDKFNVIGKDITYFIVAKRASYVRHSTVFTAANSSEAYDNLTVKTFRAFYEGDGNLHLPFRAGWGANSTHVGNNKPYIAISIFTKDNKNMTKINNSNYTTINLTSTQIGEFNANQLLIATTKQNNNYGSNYNGYIAEIIIYNRALKSGEIKLIENYLSNKYNINLNN